MQYSPEQFYKERSMIYEPDAKPYNEENNDTVKSEAPPGAEFQRPVCFSSAEYEAHETKKPKQPHIGLLLIFGAIAGAAAGFVLFGRFFTGVSAEAISDYLTLRIHGGFFANASSSFFGSALWLLIPFIFGLCAIGQPVAAIFPLLKGIGTGIIFAQLIKLYGAGGIPAFCLLVLPSAAAGLLLLVYQCRCALQSSSRLLMYIRGRNTDARPESYYKAYLYRSAVCLMGCLAAGIIDAVVSLFADMIFII